MLPFDASQSLGVFIGVEEFPDDPSIDEADFAVDDAIDLAHLCAFDLRLIPPHRITVALSGVPTKSVTKVRLRELRTRGAEIATATRSNLLSLALRMQQEASASGLLLVSISSHGFDYEGEHIFLAQDTLSQELRETALSVRKVLNAASASASKRQVIFIDACRARVLRDRALTTQEKASATLKKALSESHGQAILAAARSGGYAYGSSQFSNGVFMKAVMDGLRCQAASDARGFVTVNSLADYVNRTVISWIRSRTYNRKKVNRGIDRSLGGPAEHLPLANCNVPMATDSSARPTPICTSAIFDLDKGTLSDLSAGVSEEKIKERFPCGHVLIPSDFQQLAGVFYPKAGFRFATWMPTIQILSTFEGEIWLDRRKVDNFFEMQPESIVYLLGQPDHERFMRLYWDRSYGCLEVTFLVGTVHQIQVHSRACTDLLGSWTPSLRTSNSSR